MHKVAIASLWFVAAWIWLLHKAICNAAYTAESTDKLRPVCPFLWKSSHATYQLHVWIRGVAYGYERWLYKLHTNQCPEGRCMWRDPLSFIGLNVWGVARFTLIGTSVGTTLLIFALISKLIVG